MLRIGIIGYGERAQGMARGLKPFGIPYRIEAICDPRKDEIIEKDDGFLQGCTFFDTPEDMLDRAELDGVMIGTRCNLHTPMAVKVAERKLPLFLEKPVAISFDQVKALDAAFRDYPAPVVVSFPLRTSPILEHVKGLVDDGVIGHVEHVAAVNDVPYGTVYWHSFYRNFDEVGGLFLQKATHDLDYVQYLIGQQPKQICAMHANRIYGDAGTIYPGDHPNGLKCVDCGEQEFCPESPWNLFYERHQGAAFDPMPDRCCLFAEGIQNEDLGQCIIEYEGGAQANYVQNFFVRHGAGRRGARIYGYEGTIEFDWYKNEIQVHRHRTPKHEVVRMGGGMSHFGGDRELCYDFLMAMREGQPPRAGIQEGILSALTCLWARESAEKRQFFDVRMPD